MSLVINLAKLTGAKSYRSQNLRVEEVDVSQNRYDDKVDIKNISPGETSMPKGPVHIDMSQLPAPGEGIFKYFVDGSRRTYKVDDIVYGKKIFPVIAAQTMSACCQRLPPSRHLKNRIFDHKVILAIPDMILGGHTSKEKEVSAIALVRDINNAGYIRWGRELDTIIGYKSDNQEGTDTYLSRAISKTHSYMLFNEQKLLATLIDDAFSLDRSAYVMKDGSLEYSELSSKGPIDKSQLGFSKLIGVSKTFNPEAMRKYSKDITRIISALRPGQRTPCFRYKVDRIQNVEFAVWYLKLRDATDPFAGCVKVEKLMIKRTELRSGVESDEIDLISRNILAERLPTTFGMEDRWANHLYPIYLTERYMKSQYISDVAFLKQF